MGSDRANPGASTPMGQMGAPRIRLLSKNIGQGLWYVTMSFSDRQSSVKSLPKVWEMAFQRLQIQIFSGWACPGPLENSCIYGARLVPLTLLLGGGLQRFWTGGPWYNVIPLKPQLGIGIGIGKQFLGNGIALLWYNVTPLKPQLGIGIGKQFLGNGIALLKKRRDYYLIFNKIFRW
jgi:hypothetical protein